MGGCGSLALRQDQHSIFWFVGIAMPEGDGSLFDDLDAAPQRLVGEPLMNSPRDNGPSISCTAQCKRETVSAIRATRLSPGTAPKAGREKLKIEFAKLSKSNAWPLQCWQVCEVSSRSA